MLTFLALKRHLLEKNRTFRLIPREQVSEGLFMAAGAARFNDLNRHWRINKIFKQVRIDIFV
jgi:hypothetical protein